MYNIKLLQFTILAEVSALLSYSEAVLLQCGLSVGGILKPAMLSRSRTICPFMLMSS